MLSKLDNSFTRFLAVGVLNTMVGLSAVYLLLNLFGLKYWPATFFGNAIGAVVSYFLNRAFTFGHQGSMQESMWRFGLVITVCYVVAYWIGLEAVTRLLSMFTTNTVILENVAVLCGAGLYTILNYFGQRFFVFPKKKVQAT